MFLVGGGSGGHITPILSVASKIKELNPDICLVYIGQKGDDMSSLVTASSHIDSIELIPAGKFRRYHNSGIIKQLLDVKTVYLNSRDLSRVFRGYVQAKKLLNKYAPSVILANGGFVGVPVGLAAVKKNIPIITHDKDALPGLANRILSKYAAVHAVSLPVEVYKDKYPLGKTVSVGTPISEKYYYVTAKIMQKFRDELSLPKNAKVILVTGGSLGAHRLNDAVLVAAPELLKNPQIYLIHITGKSHFETIKRKYEALGERATERVRVIDFTTEIDKYSGAADVVITRSGASAMAELAMQAKAVVIVPNPVLTGGHQLINARAYAKSEAAIVIQEEELGLRLIPVIDQLLGDDALRISLASNIHAFAHKNAAGELAKLILDTISIKK